MCWRRKRFGRSDGVLDAAVEGRGGGAQDGGAFLAGMGRRAAGIKRGMA